ncbi:Uncharacterised protein g7149 [Pycnogonum litorale]
MYLQLQVLIGSLLILDLRVDGSVNIDSYVKHEEDDGPVPPSRPAVILPNHTDENEVIFDLNIKRNNTVQVGKTAYLMCRVENIGDKTVSWVRQSDLHILTVGEFTYTSDARFSCFYRPDTEDWLLEIKYPRENDSGVYECQVSTEPKISLEIYLKVIVARAMIKGAPDLYVKSGSSMELDCIVVPPMGSPRFIFWHHNEKVINYDSPRGHRIRVDTPKDLNIVSTLKISNIDIGDSGNYTCVPSYADPASIKLHVLDSEAPAAMQHEQRGGTCSIMICSSLISSYVYIVIRTTTLAIICAIFDR